MTCTVVQTDTGPVIICGGRRLPPLRCVVCGHPGATQLCDGPPPKGSRLRTCSRPLHALCSSGRLVLEDVDHCPECWRARGPDWAKPAGRVRQGELF